MSVETRLRILVVDNHTEVLKQIETRLSYEKDFEVCGCASVSELARCVMNTRPDVLLIDPHVNNAYRYDAIRLAKKIMPRMTVVVLTAVVDKAAEMKLKRDGVAYILEKGGDSSQLVDALRGIVVEKANSS